MAQTADPTSRSLRLGMLLTFVGGFMDAYTYVSRGGVFANAQTGNVVLLAIALAGHRWAPIAKYVMPILAFVFGAIGAEMLRLPFAERTLRYPARVAIVLEIAVFVVVGALPAAVPDTIVTVVIAAMSGLQVTSFRHLGQWSYNTTITTGNIRSAAQAAVHAIADHDPAAWAKCWRLGVIILCFTFGGAAGGTLTKGLHGPAIWAAAAVLAGCLLLFIMDDRKARQRTPVARSQHPGPDGDLE